MLLLVMHHIASDGWSTGPFWRDLAVAYGARCGGRAPQWPALPVQYADFAVWQRELLGDGDDPQSLMARQLGYWEQNLAGLPDQLELPADRPRPAAASHEGGSVEFELGPELHAALAGLARESDVTIFMVVQAAVAALLTLLGAGTDIPLGASVAGRTDVAMDDLVGFFVNTLVLRTSTAGDPSFRELLARVRETDLAAYEHQDVPFEKIVEKLNPARSMARHPLFQVSVAFQNISGSESLSLPGLEVADCLVDVGSAKFDLNFTFGAWREADGRLGPVSGLVNYNADLFDRATIEALAAGLARVFQVVAADPRTRIGQLELMAPRGTWPPASAGGSGKRARGCRRGAASGSAASPAGGAGSAGPVGACRGVARRKPDLRRAG